jgi:oxygen-independent coproporphyrinogen-3 oxidase
MNRGVDLARLQGLCPEAPWERIEALMVRLTDEGLAARDGTHVRLEARGRLLADAIGTEVMVAFDRPAAARAVPA